MPKPVEYNLRSLRKKAAITLRELARQIGEAPTSVSYWERTGTLPRSDVVVRIAKVLRLSVDEVLGEAKPTKSVLSKGRVREAFEQVQSLPHREQDKILDVVEALLAKASRKKQG